MLDDFFAEKENIAHVFALADIRHDPTRDDLTMIDYLYYERIPFTVVATKSDQTCQDARERRRAQDRRRLQDGRRQRPARFRRHEKGQRRSLVLDRKNLYLGNRDGRGIVRFDV